MPNDLEYSTFFVELDTLLDTRLSIIARLGDDVLKEAVLNNYHDRKIDKFKGVDPEYFKEAYANRDKSVLKDTIITPIGPMIKEYVLKTLSRVGYTPFNFRPRIMINIYPYKLTTEEVNIIKIAVVSMTNKLADVEIVSMNYEDITPNFIKASLTMMCMYDYHEWLNIHGLNGNFKKKTIPEINLLGPRIYFLESQVYDDKAISALEDLVAPVVNLTLLPIKNFSAIISTAKTPSHG
jgi:hypothetical protein